MAWNSVTERLPAPLERVWVMTSTGRQTTGYLKTNGEWFLFCRKIAAENPAVLKWKV